MSPGQNHLVGQMDSQALPFIFVETSDLDQQVVNGCARNNPVTAEPSPAMRTLR